MKKHLLKPGFELIFSLTLLAIFGLPHLILAQNVSKDMEIIIINGDTTINGKKMKDLSATERTEALGSIKRYSGDVIINGDKPNVKRNIVIKKRGGLSGDGDIRFDGPMFRGDSLVIADGNVRIFRDSSGRGLRLRSRSLDKMGDDIRLNLNSDPGQFDSRARVYSFNAPSRPMRVSMHRRNSQNFSYSNTDKNGISTNVNYRVTDESGDKGGELNDLSIMPEFSSGKTTLSFNLDSKAGANVSLKDDEGKVLWTDKTSGGRFNKSFGLALNGIYYLHVKQGTKTTVKKIVKE